MGSGASSHDHDPHNTHHVKRGHFSKHRKRPAVKDNQKTLKEEVTKHIKEQYDKDKDGVLDREEIRALCKSIMQTDSYAPILNREVTDADVDEVMRIGDIRGSPDGIKVEHIPEALSTILALQSENQRIHDLFHKYDIDGNKNLSEGELRNLLTEVNDGFIPSASDLKFIMEKCSGEDKVVDEHEIKAVFEVWYVLVDENPLPTTKEEAKAMGYTDEQIKHFIEDMEAAEAEENAEAPSAEQLEKAAEAALENAEADAPAADPAAAS